MSKKQLIIGSIIIVCLGVIGGLFFFLNQNKVKEIKLSDEDKVKINDSLNDLAYLLRTTRFLTNEGSNIYEVNYNYLDKDDNAYDFAIQSLYFNKNVAITYNEEESVTDLKITTDSLNNYYHSLYGIDFDASKISDDTKSGFSLENNEISTSFNMTYMGPLYFLKVNHKEYLPKTKVYTLYIDYLAKEDGTFFDSETEDISFSEPNILDYQNDLKQATLILEYKVNSDNTYQLNSLKFVK